MCLVAFSRAALGQQKVRDPIEVKDQALFNDECGRANLAEQQAHSTNFRGEIVVILPGITMFDLEITPR